jgi:uncharacterized protein (TIGR03663 family)
MVDDRRRAQPCKNTQPRPRWQDGDDPHREALLNINRPTLRWRLSTGPAFTRRVPSVSGAAIVVDAPATTSRAVSRPAAAAAERTLRVPLELVLYVVLALAAAVMRLWDLSSRAEHHDESLHAYFSWLYSVGDGYVHDPLMHGPTLFHANALAYLLFGDSDYTSRLWPALMGIVLALMPFLLRGPQLLGRWGALACSALLVFSPTLLYQTRYIRHDPFVLVATFAIVISALRYLERPERRWIITAGIMTGFMFATMEVSFIIAFVVVTFVVGVTCWQISKPALAYVLLTGAGLLAAWKVLPALGAPALPTIPWEHPTGDNLRAFTEELIVHPLALASLGIVLLGIVLVTGALDRVRDRAERTWLEGVLATAPPDTTSRALFNLVRDRRALWLATALGLTIFAALYTSMYTNMFGLGSGTVGALGYWLGQHDVQRADQPWFYYLLLLPQYELIAVLVFPLALVLTARNVIPGILAGQPVGRRNYLRGFVIYWALVNLAVFSWAGEKMPWLSVHMALPLIILAASFIGEAIERVELAARDRRLPAAATWILAFGVPAIAGAWFLLWSWGSAGDWVERDGMLQRSLRPEVADNPWVLYLPLAALAGLVVYGIVRLGSKTALPLLGLTGIGVLLAGQMHVSFRMTYLEGDVPRDMLIYVQSSPDVSRTVAEIGVLSRELSGGLDMPIAYDSGTSWPFQWYLRDYTQRRYFGDVLSEPPDEPIVLIANENLTPENQDLLAGYTYTEYAMRWWFPEDETYRRFAIAPELNKAERQNYQTDEQGPFTAVDVAESVWRSFWGMRDPQQQAKIFRLVAFRELWAPIGSYNFRVYVRNDLLQTWNDIRY